MRLPKATPPPTSLCEPGRLGGSPQRPARSRVPRRGRRALTAAPLAAAPSSSPIDGQRDGKPAWSPASPSPRPPGARTPPPRQLPFPKGSCKPDALAPTQRVGTVVRRRRRRRGRRREESEEEGAALPRPHSAPSGRPALVTRGSGAGRACGASAAARVNRLRAREPRAVGKRARWGSGGRCGGSPSVPPPGGWGQTSPPRGSRQPPGISPSGAVAPGGRLPFPGETKLRLSSATRLTEIRLTLSTS